MKIKPIIKGLVTFVPSMKRFLPKRGTGGTNSALYCYGVWLKHLTMLWENGMRSMPNTFGELGPGDSLGVGLSAMLSSVNNYYALDVVDFANATDNIYILDKLLELFETRAGRPSKSWPDYDDYLDNQLFPSHILTNEVLNSSLSEYRVMLIRKTLSNLKSNNNKSTIKYIVPWSKGNIIEKDTVDLVISHSVLEHVIDLEETYRSLSSWIKPKGFMSHQIDFTSHELSRKWNGHWACSEIIWKIINGKRPFLINRQPFSVHLDLIEKNGFKIICHLKQHRVDGIQRSKLSSRWKTISDDDLTCSGAFIQAQKQ